MGYARSADIVPPHVYAGVAMLFRQFVFGVRVRGRGELLEMLFGEQRQILLLHEWFGVELG